MYTSRARIVNTCRALCLPLPLGAHGTEGGKRWLGLFGQILRSDKWKELPPGSTRAAALCLKS
jgi:hypothetical protein